MKQVGFHPEAVQELAEHESWYREKSEMAAQGFLLELTRAISNVAEFPERWPVASRGERRFVFPRYPFTLLYATWSSSRQSLIRAGVPATGGIESNRGPRFNFELQH